MSDRVKPSKPQSIKGSRLNNSVLLESGCSYDDVQLQTWLKQIPVNYVEMTTSGNESVQCVCVGLRGSTCVRMSNLQLPRELHMVVVDQDVGNELFLPCREGQRSLCDVWTDVHFQECMSTSGAVPHLQTITTITTSHGVKLHSRERNMNVWREIPPEGSAHSWNLLWSKRAITIMDFLYFPFLNLSSFYNTENEWNHIDIPCRS